LGLCSRFADRRLSVSVIEGAPVQRRQIREKFIKERTATRNFAKDWRLRCILTDSNTRHSRNVQQEHSKEAAN
jgi:hypothetical protein